MTHIDGGIEKIRAFLHEYGQSEQEAEMFELGFLLRLRREVEEERPIGPVERLQQQLDLAVTLEEYEEAARIRDQLQRLRRAGRPRTWKLEPRRDFVADFLDRGPDPG